jgi:uncharacterized protein YjlB
MDVRTHLLKDDGVIPNNPRLPLVLYPDVVRTDAGPSTTAGFFETIFSDNGWGRSWRNGVFPYHHYHSTQHEVLGVYAGWAEVQFGGEAGLVEVLRAGDAVVIPAGVAHKRISASGDFGVVGAYPPGDDWDMNYGRMEERAEALRNIEAVPPPPGDPVLGEGGPLEELWRL